MTTQRTLIGRYIRCLYLLMLIQGACLLGAERATAQLRGRVLNSRPLTQPIFESALNPLPFREGQFVDGLSTLIVRDGRLSTIEVNVLPQDELWMLDGRQCHLAPDDLTRIKARRLVGETWVDESIVTLTANHANDKSKATLIYAHGNRTDEDWAIWRGLQFYQNSFGDNGNCRPPVRFVIWSWQAEQGNYRLSKDYRVKSARAVVVGRSLANVLSQFSDQQMVLVGFSLGAQAFLSALNQYHFQMGEPKLGRYRVALIAPALDGCFVSQQTKRFPNSVAVERAVVFDNSVDRALRVSKVVRRRQCPAGDTPLAELVARGNLPLTTIAIKDMSNEVGKGHSIDRYTRNESIRTELNQMLNEVVAEYSIVP